MERKGAKTALLTTKGMRDVLEIGREGRYDMYDLFIDHPRLVSQQMGSRSASASSMTGPC